MFASWYPTLSVIVYVCVCMSLLISHSTYICLSLCLGIPVYQQQLVYGDTELQDENCLAEHGIPSGAQLKLLIAMRGGPIHAQRSKPMPQLLCSTLWTSFLLQCPHMHNPGIERKLNSNCFVRVKGGVVKSKLCIIKSLFLTVVNVPG